jgi:hypothetical protein
MVQTQIQTMLDAVDVATNPSNGPVYPILRVLVAYPLDIDLNALKEDDHPLAVLFHSALASVLVTNPQGGDLIKQLQNYLLRR